MYYTVSTEILLHRVKLYRIDWNTTAVSSKKYMLIQSILQN